MGKPNEQLQALVFSVLSVKPIIKFLLNIGNVELTCFHWILNQTLQTQFWHIWVHASCRRTAVEPLVYLNMLVQDSVCSIFLRYLNTMCCILA
jgi:hypothetical protein